MTGKSTVTHREWIKERRLEKVRYAQEGWSDEAYGLKVQETRAGVRLTWALDRDAFVALMALHQLRDGLLERFEFDLVVKLRSEGLPWEEIGWALGLSRQAVQKRHPGADQAARALVSGGEVEG